MTKPDHNALVPYRLNAKPEASPHSIETIEQAFDTFVGHTGCYRVMSTTRPKEKDVFALAESLGTSVWRWPYGSPAEFVVTSMLSLNLTLPFVLGVAPFQTHAMPLWIFVVSSIALFYPLRAAWRTLERSKERRWALDVIHAQIGFSETANLEKKIATQTKILSGGWEKLFLRLDDALDHATRDQNRPPSFRDEIAAVRLRFNEVCKLWQASMDQLRMDHERLLRLFDRYLLTGTAEQAATVAQFNETVRDCMKRTDGMKTVLNVSAGPRVMQDGWERSLLSNARNAVEDSHRVLSYLETPRLRVEINTLDDGDAQTIGDEKDVLGSRSALSCRL